MMKEFPPSVQAMRPSRSDYDRMDFDPPLGLIFVITCVGIINHFPQFGKKCRDVSSYLRLRRGSREHDLYNW